MKAQTILRQFFKFSSCPLKFLYKSTFKNIAKTVKFSFRILSNFSMLTEYLMLICVRVVVKSLARVATLRNCLI